ncbi:RlpA-like double-psi beta-barrel-protein domain-containing protein-containing protein [Chytridium lagenaria]|nr:RlpA-like double-psi beta-barrel-protein domain-containing protein-containing protein [Chytridium lagenaria]
MLATLLISGLILCVQVNAHAVAPFGGHLASNVSLARRQATFAGDGTYYNPAGGYGACGTILRDSDNIVALASSYFNQFTPNGNPNRNTLCNRCILATSLATGRSIRVTVQDSCPGCKGHDLDLSEGAFRAIDDVGKGRIKVTWTYCDGTPMGSPSPTAPLVVQVTTRWSSPTTTQRIATTITQRSTPRVTTIPARTTIRASLPRTTTSPLRCPPSSQCRTPGEMRCGDAGKRGDYCWCTSPGVWTLKMCARGLACFPNGGQVVCDRPRG